MEYVDSLRDLDLFVLLLCVCLEMRDVCNGEKVCVMEKKCM